MIAHTLNNNYLNAVNVIYYKGRNSYIILNHCVNFTKTIRFCQIIVYYIICIDYLVGVVKMDSNKTQNKKLETKYIKELDGLRALFIIIVVWYHIWQQSWLDPKIGNFSIDGIIRSGSICVDALILLSGFCLFLPYARSMVYGEKMPSTKKFFINRVARIVPSYLFAILVVLIFFIIPNKEYDSVSFALKDIFSHLFFVHNLVPEIMHSTKILGVLWTVGVEVQLYLLFPFIAKAFSKKPFLTYISTVSVSLLSCYLICGNFDNISHAYWVNNTLTFICVFVNGIFGAWIYMRITKKYPTKGVLPLLFTLISLGFIFMYTPICDFRMAYGDEQKWQIDFRYLLSFFYLGFIVSTILASSWYRKLFNNKIMKFIALISYNIYIYHQFIAVKLVEFKIPSWDGDELPNVIGNSSWQIKYSIICVLIILLIATLATILVEKPASKIIKKLVESKKE